MVIQYYTAKWYDSIETDFFNDFFLHYTTQVSFSMKLHELYS